ncbi:MULTISPECIES: phage tail tape measure protein [unclassified Cytobacillus]|uniref:phage tail tape measure protein n=1 Tax=unclassified Cytobacillus TaxID=2675268 RepID=UPI00203D4C50|nr:phage tail tape measure protein [Cytobacillus sp. AMY 15.2]MCM3090203.1 phage tail tape measure protein [Cytobacillus sp. AMY 15.2]
MASGDGRIVINTEINTNNVESGLQQIERRVQDVADRMGSIGERMNKAVTVPLTAMGAAGVTAAMNVGEAQTKLRNSLGLTAKETEKLTQYAKNVYTAGYGESLEDVTNALIETKQNMRGLNDQDLEKATKSALNLANTFDADVNEVTRAGGNLMEAFGISSDEAFDLMAHGAQNGLNFSKEMFDNLSEYSPLFGEMGFTAAEYFQLLEQGSKAGVYNLDYVNDVMKEFQIRVKDGSKSTSDAMSQMSESTQKVWKDFLAGKGTVKDVHNAVIKELKDMDDQVKANEIGVGLYGTKWEDLEADAMYALGGIDGGIQDAKGSMEEMNKVTEESFGTKWKQFTREALISLEPLGKVLLDFAMVVLPYVSDAISFVANAFGSMDPVMQAIVVGIGMIAAAIGPFLTVLGAMIPHITTALNWFTKLKAIFPLIRTAMMALTGPVGIISAIVVALAFLIYQNWDDISKWTKEKWGQLKTFLSNFWDATKLVFEKTVQFITDFVKKSWEATKKKTEEIYKGIKNFFVNTWNSMKDAAQNTAENIRSYISSKWQSIKDKTTSIYDSIKSKIQNTLTSAYNLVKDKAQAIWQAMKDRFYALKDVVQEGMNRVKETAQRLWGYVEDFFRRIDLKNIGRNIIQGLINGLTGMLGSLMRTASNIANSIKDKIKGALRIHSPSRVAIELGGFFTEGLEDGLLSRAKQLMKASTQIGETVAVGTRKPLNDARLDISNQKIRAAQAANLVTNTVHKTIQLIMPNVRNERDATGISQRLASLENRSLRVGGVSG